MRETVRSLLFASPYLPIPRNQSDTDDHFMKIPALIAAIVISTLSPVFAVTQAEIAPAALAGKTLTFTIENGGSPYPTNGTWTGSFGASGTDFTVANITGDTAPVSTTYTAVVDGIFTDISLGKFVEGQPAAILSLYIQDGLQDGVGRYEVFIPGIFGVSLTGTFTVGSSTATGPDIKVTLSNGGKITDGKSTTQFGAVQIRKTGSPKSYVIRNTGKSALTTLGFTIGGTNKKDYILSSPKISKIAPNASVTIRVSFKPKALGKRKAVLHIMSNNQEESSFDINLVGSGVAIK